MPLRIVVADDNADIRDTLATALRLLGHAVEAAASGAEALQRMEDSSPDLALIDVGMPGMSGYQVAESVRRRRDGNAPILIAMTGWGSDADRARALEAGFDQHLAKPIDLAQLRSLLAAVTPTDNTLAR